MFRVFKDKRHLVEFCCAFALILTMILFVTFRYDASKQASMFLRMLAGSIIGYALARASFGFAGTVNRACNTGSTKLMKAVALLFLLGGLVTFVAILGGVLNPAKLSGNTINYGLIIGATLFGFGMSFTVCCASGVLTDLAESPIKAIFVLLFFCFGAFLGLALKKQEWMAWYKQPLFGITGLNQNINFTHMVSGNVLWGAIVGVIMTFILVSCVIIIADFYEKRRKAANTYIGCGSELAQEKEAAEHVKDENAGVELFYNVFTKPWTLAKGATVIAIGYAVLVFGLKSGWGVSGPLGQWFARLLMIFGVPAEAIKNFSGYNPATPFWDNAMYVQDISIFLGALIAYLLAGNFTRNVKGWLFKPLELVLYAIGGIILGIAINLAGGCNAGGLFTPIAQFSLSGWIYLVCIVVGGFAGNYVRKVFRKTCKLD